MKLYLLFNFSDLGYDKMSGHLIRAASEKRAREIANGSVGDEGRIWDDSEKVSCEIVSSEGIESIIISDFHAG